MHKASTAKPYIQSSSAFSGIGNGGSGNSVSISGLSNDQTMKDDIRECIGYCLDSRYNIDAQVAKLFSTYNSDHNNLEFLSSIIKETFILTLRNKTGDSNTTIQSHKVHSGSSKAVLGGLDARAMKANGLQSLPGDLGTPSPDGKGGIVYISPNDAGAASIIYGIDRERTNNPASSGGSDDEASDDRDSEHDSDDYADINSIKVTGYEKDSNENDNDGEDDEGLVNIRMDCSVRISSGLLPNPNHLTTEGSPTNEVENQKSTIFYKSTAYDLVQSLTDDSRQPAYEYGYSDASLERSLSDSNRLDTTVPVDSVDLRLPSSVNGISNSGRSSQGGKGGSNSNTPDGNLNWMNRPSKLGTISIDNLAKDCYGSFDRVSNSSSFLDHASPSFVAPSANDKTTSTRFRDSRRFQSGYIDKIIESSYVVFEPDPSTAGYNSGSDIPSSDCSDTNDDNNNNTNSTGNGNHYSNIIPSNHVYCSDDEFGVGNNDLHDYDNSNLDELWSNALVSNVYCEEEDDGGSSDNSGPTAGEDKALSNVFSSNNIFDTLRENIQNNYSPPRPFSLKDIGPEDFVFSDASHSNHQTLSMQKSTRMRGHKSRTKAEIGTSESNEALTMPPTSGSNVDVDSSVDVQGMHTYSDLFEKLSKDTSTRYKKKGGKKKNTSGKTKVKKAKALGDARDSLKPTATSASDLNSGKQGNETGSQEDAKESSNGNDRFIVPSSSPVKISNSQASPEKNSLTSKPLSPTSNNVARQYLYGIYDGDEASSKNVPRSPFHDTTPLLLPHSPPSSSNKGKEDIASGNAKNYSNGSLVGGKYGEGLKVSDDELEQDVDDNALNHSTHSIVEFVVLDTAANIVQILNGSNMSNDAAWTEDALRNLVKLVIVHLNMFEKIDLSEGGSPMKADVFSVGGHGQSIIVDLSQRLQVFCGQAMSKKVSVEIIEVLDRFFSNFQRFKDTMYPAIDDSSSLDSSDSDDYDDAVDSDSSGISLSSRSSNPSTGSTGSSTLEPMTPLGDDVDENSHSFGTGIQDGQGTSTGTITSGGRVGANLVYNGVHAPASSASLNKNISSSSNNNNNDNNNNNNYNNNNNSDNNYFRTMNSSNNYDNIATIPTTKYSIITSSELGNNNNFNSSEFNRTRLSSQSSSSPSSNAISSPRSAFDGIINLPSYDSNENFGEYVTIDDLPDTYETDIGFDSVAGSIGASYFDDSSYANSPSTVNNRIDASINGFGPMSHDSSNSAGMNGEISPLSPESGIKFSISNFLNSFNVQEKNLIDCKLDSSTINAILSDLLLEGEKASIPSSGGGNMSDITTTLKDLHAQPTASSSSSSSSSYPSDEFDGFGQFAATVSDTANDLDIFNNAPHPSSFFGLSSEGGEVGGEGAGGRFNLLKFVSNPELKLPSLTSNPDLDTQIFENFKLHLKQYSNANLQNVNNDYSNSSSSGSNSNTSGDNNVKFGNYYQNASSAADNDNFAVDNESDDGDNHNDDDDNDDDDDEEEEGIEWEMSPKRPHHDSERPEGFRYESDGFNGNFITASSFGRSLSSSPAGKTSEANYDNTVCNYNSFSASKDRNLGNIRYSPSIAIERYGSTLSDSNAKTLISSLDSDAKRQPRSPPSSGSDSPGLVGLPYSPSQISELYHIRHLQFQQQERSSPGNSKNYNNNDGKNSSSSKKSSSDLPAFYNPYLGSGLHESSQEEEEEEEEDDDDDDDEEEGKGEGEEEDCNLNEEVNESYDDTADIRFSSFTSSGTRPLTAGATANFSQGRSSRKQQLESELERKNESFLLLSSNSASRLRSSVEGRAGIGTKQLGGKNNSSSTSAEPLSRNRTGTAYASLSSSYGGNNNSSSNNYNYSSNSNQRVIEAALTSNINNEGDHKARSKRHQALSPSSSSRVSYNVDASSEHRGQNSSLRKSISASVSSQGKSSNSLFRGVNTGTVDKAYGSSQRAHGGRSSSSKSKSKSNVNSSSYSNSNTNMNSSSYRNSSTQRRPRSGIAGSAPISHYSDRSSSKLKSQGAFEDDIFMKKLKTILSRK